MQVKHYVALSVVGTHRCRQGIFACKTGTRELIKKMGFYTMLHLPNLRICSELAKSGTMGRSADITGAYSNALRKCEALMDIYWATPKYPGGDRRSVRCQYEFFAFI